MVAEHAPAARARAARRDGERVISNVVMMGMGEPLQNFDGVLPALRLMLDDHAYGLSRRRVTVSTSGMVPQIDRLARGLSGGAGGVAACARTTRCATSSCRSTGSTRCAN